MTVLVCRFSAGTTKAAALDMFSALALGICGLQMLQIRMIGSKTQEIVHRYTMKFASNDVQKALDVEALTSKLRNWSAHCGDVMPLRIRRMHIHKVTSLISAHRLPSAPS